MRICRDPYGEEVVRELIKCLQINRLRAEGFRVVHSDSETSAVARIWGVNKVLQVGLDLEPSYVIELVEPKFSNLPCLEKLRTLLHELAHVPKTFSGYVRPHNRWFKQDLRVWLRSLRTLSNAEIRDLCGKLDEGLKEVLESYWKG